MPKLQSELDDIKARLEPLDARANELLAQVQRLANGDAKSYYEAQRKFWNFLYTHDRELWYVLDPVVSVHPDAVLFEVF